MINKNQTTAKKIKLRSQLGQSIINFIINRSKLIEIIFAVLFIISAICFPFVEVNYDLSKYLPAGMTSKQGIDLMEKEFGYPGTARVMIDDVSLYEAKLYKDRIEQIDGVDMVLWADSLTDIYQANQFINYDDIKDYYKDNTAIMDVTFTGNDSAASTRNALEEIENMLGDKGHFGGAAVQNKFQSEVLMSEMATILSFGILIILGILTLATNSWFEPLLFLLVILISVVINMGSNLILGSISSITLSVAAALQLAIAMDYTIILLDNFTIERKLRDTVEEALAVSIRKSLIPIASAGAAAIVGFLALLLMRYNIGKDIGLVLAKGIAISLVTVVFLTPAFVLRWYKLIEKTEHKPLVPSFRKAAEKIYQLRFIFLLFLLLVAVPAYFGKDMTDFSYGNDAMGLSKGTIVYEDNELMNAKFGRNNLVLALVPNTSLVEERMLSDKLEDLTVVKSVTSLANQLPQGVPADFLPESITSRLHTENYARILISIRTKSESDLAFESVEKITDLVQKYYPQGSYIVGVTPSTKDIKEVIRNDWTSIDTISMLGVALTIMVAFRSLVLPIILMIPIRMAVFVNMMVPYITGSSILFMGYIIVSCLQLGATIDYSIIMTYRYLAYRKEKDKVAASISAAEASILPILTSGLILAVAGYGVYFFSSVTGIADLGRLIGRGALLSMFMVIALLPNLFVWADKLISFKKGKSLPEALGKIFKKTSQLSSQ